MSNVNNGVLKEGRMQTFLGKMTAYQRDGESILRGTTPTQVNNPQTAAQMYHRLRLPNLIGFYRVVRKFNKKGWENLPAKTSLYNCYVGANMDIAPLGIRKSDFERGMTLVEAYQVTQGSLPSIVVDTQSHGTTQGVTDIRVGNLESISSSTTIGDLAKAIVESNGGAYQYGDEIAFLLCEQFWNEGVALVRSKRTAVTLLRDSQETLGDMNLKGFGVVDGMIGIQGSAPLGGYCWVHSRKDEWNDKLRVSTQRIVVVDDMVLQTYRQPEQMRQAAEDQGAKFVTTALLECHSDEEAAILTAFGLPFKKTKDDADSNALRPTIVSFRHGDVLFTINQRGIRLSSDKKLECHSDEEAAILTAFGMPFKKTKDDADSNAQRPTIVSFRHGDVLFTIKQRGIRLSSDKKLEVAIGNAELIDESSLTVSVNGVACEAMSFACSTLPISLAESLDGQVLTEVEILSNKGKASAKFN